MLYFRTNTELRWRCPSQAKWLSPFRMRKASPAPLRICGRRWQGKWRCFFKDWDMMERSFCLAWSGLTFRFTEPAVLCCGGMFQQQLVPFLLLPPIANVPEGVLPSKAEFIQLLWHQCDGDLTGFQGKLNWQRLPIITSSQESRTSAAKCVNQHDN